MEDNQFHNKNELRIFGVKTKSRAVITQGSNKFVQKIPPRIEEIAKYLRFKKTNENLPYFTFNLTNKRLVNSMKRIPLNTCSLRQKFGQGWKKEYLNNFKKASSYNMNNIIQSLKVSTKCVENNQEVKIPSLSTQKKINFIRFAKSTNHLFQNKLDLIKRQYSFTNSQIKDKMLLNSLNKMFSSESDLTNKRRSYFK